MGGVCGTSSGALVGSLWCSGLSAADIAGELRSKVPWELIRFAWSPAGMFRMDPAQELLDRFLPATFEELSRPFGAGVAWGGRADVLLSGALSEAVVASCSMPGVFVPVALDGHRWRDGGATDRLGLAAWQRHRPGRRVVVHRVKRSAGPATPLPEGVPVVDSDRSGASFWSLGDFDAQVEEARAATARVLAALP